MDEDMDINYVQFKWRNHDPQIGRFIEVDPLSEKYLYNSIYAFSENHVTTHIELEGLEKFPIHTDGDPSREREAQRKKLKHDLEPNGPNTNVTPLPETKTKGGFTFSLNITASLEFGAGASLGEGANIHGGKTVSLLGIKNNEFYTGAKNLSTGEVTVNTSMSGAASLALPGADYEKTQIKTSNGSYTTKNETSSVNWFFVKVTTEKNYQTKQTTQTWSLSGATQTVGIMLFGILSVDVNFYKKVTGL